MDNLEHREVIIADYLRKRLVARNTVLLLLGRFVSLIGDSIYAFAIGLYILKVTGSGLNFALTLFIATLPRVIIGPVAGVVADKLDRKKMTVILDIMSGLIVLALAGIGTIDSMKLMYIYAATFLLNVCNVFFDTAISSGIPGMVDDDNLTRINSLSSVVSSVATIVGPALGGLVFALIDIKIFLVVNGMSFILSGISEMFIDFKAKDKIYGITEVQEKEKTSFFRDLLEGIKFIWETKWLMALGSSAILLNMCMIMGINVSVPVIVKNIWGFTDTQFGLMMGAFPAGMIVASLIIAILPQSEKNFKKLICGFSAFAFTMIALGIFASGIIGVSSNIIRLIVVIVCFVIISFSATFINVPFMVTMQKEIPGEKLGRVFGVFGTFTAAAVPIGALLGGAVIDVVDPWMIPLACGIAILLIAVVSAKNKELRKI